MSNQIELDIIKLHMKAPLHLSRGRSEMDSAEHILHSDKLKSAIATAAFVLYPEWDQEARDEFFQSFKVASAYPFYKDHLLFPKPLIGLPGVKDKEGKDVPKKAKRIKYLDQATFQQLILGGMGESIQLDSLKLVNPDSDESGFIVSEQLDHQLALMESEVVLRVGVIRDRSRRPDDQEDTQLYYLERLFFGPETGLYFIIEYQDETRGKVEPQVHAALRFLGDEGIGTDRGTGNGHFEFNPLEDTEKLVLEIEKGATHQVLLSLYCPAKSDDLDTLLEESAYRIQKRGGYISSVLDEGFLSYRKKSIYMFTEGAVFSISEKNEGQIADLQPDVIEGAHPIWRDGRGIFLPIKL